jgi:signal transduction histidine kinase
VRRRLTLLVLAVTTLVVIAYTGPLAILVQRQALDRALSAGERRLQSVAADVVRVAAVTNGLDLPTLEGALQLPERLSLVTPAGERIGSGPDNVELARDAVEKRTAIRVAVDDGSWDLALPVIAGSGAVVVETRVERAEATRGVYRAWAFLGVLGMVLVGVGLVLADRLGRSLRDPVEELARAAERLGRGDLDTRVDPPVLDELRAIADALNSMAPQLRDLLIAEREAMADLSHRLRTPLAAIRLQAEATSDPAERNDLLAMVDRMQVSVDQLIHDARRVETDAECDLVVVAIQHAKFWSVLAEEQRRPFEVYTADGPLRVAASAQDLGDTIDALIGNVFSHTAPGTALALLVDGGDGFVELTVADAGPGWPAGTDPVSRGESGSGSTGLGLDIARRLAERAGGGIRLSGREGGGAIVGIRLRLLE